ncbi:MAG: response regulator [Ruminiclostridium sp.]|nr:response regulator [Ruminiclostridium sp.]
MDKRKTSIFDILMRFGARKIAAALFVPVFFTVLLSVYGVQIYNSTMTTIRQSGEINAIDSADRFSALISKGIDVIELTEYSVSTMIKENASEEEILAYLTRETDMILGSVVPNTTGLYAYINGKYYDGAGWVPDEDYVPTERPWYIRTVENSGKVTVVDPYLDMQTGGIILTLAKSTEDGKNVVALDITMDEIQAIVDKETAQDGLIAEIVLCGDGTVVAHSDRNELGKNYFDGSDSFGTLLAKKLRGLGEHTFDVDFNGKKLIIYAVPIQNGWYSVSVSDADSAYRPLRITMWVGIGAMLITLLIIAVIIVRAAKRDLIAERLNAQLISSADIYMSVCDLDIPNNDVTAIKNANPAIAKAVGACDHNMQEIFFGIMRVLPENPTKKAAIEFANLSTIDERMKERNVVTLEYLSYGNIWVRARYIVSERDKAGRVKHVLWMLENIDTEKRERDRLSEKNVNLRSQLESAADIYISLCELDIPDNSVVEIKNANPAIARAVGACDHNMQEIFFGIMKGLPENPTKQAAVDFADMSRIDEYLNGTNTVTLEYLSYGNIWVRARYVVSERAEDGKVIKVLWMLENIDKEKQARDKLTAVAQKLNNQISSIANIYMSVYDFDLTKDTLSEVKAGSRQLTDIVGNDLSHAQATLNNVVRQMTDASTLDAMLEFIDLSTLDKRLAEEQTIAMEYLSKDKKWRRGRFIVSERSSLGKPVHVLGLFEDIDNERKEREKLIDMSQRAIAASEAKSAFLSNMSHEIRTPINAVLGMNEMVLRESTDSNIIEYSESIRTAGTTLLGLINDILDFSKIEAGKMEIIPVDYELASMLNDLVNMIRARAEAKGLMLVPDFDCNMPEYLHGDEVRIKQVITNILTNAVKYTEKGSVTLSVGYRKLEDEPDAMMLTVSVKDTGIGIKKADMAKLFTQFERIEEKRNRSIEGTGLGMSITQSLLTMMNSSLKVESVYGVGSIFSFEIKQTVRRWDPIGDYQKAYKNAISEHEKYKEKFTAPDARVLVVDDTPMNLIVFKSLLKQTDVHIDTADSGDEGIVLALKNKYDIIFLDHMMPNKDGIETLKELKASDSDLNRDTPMICLTANAISGAREKYLQAGFDDYLTKPIDSAALENMMYERLPKEKIKTVQEIPKREPKQRQTLPDFIFDTPELDVSEGIKNSGNEDIYCEVLKTYSKMLLTLTDEINECYESGDTVMMCRKLGTLKSSSRTAGAEWIMRLASDLKAQAGSEEGVIDTRKLEELTKRCKWLSVELSMLNIKSAE